MGESCTFSYPSLFVQHAEVPFFALMGQQPNCRERTSYRHRRMPCRSACVGAYTAVRTENALDFEVCMKPNCT